MVTILKGNVVVATSDKMPDLMDLETRGETAIQETGEVGQIWDGEVFIDPPEQDVVPKTATKLSLYEELKASGDWAVIAGALKADEDALNTWNFASSIDRYHPMIEQFRLLLGWTAKQVDELFKAAQ